jgi:hypothetical protein
MQSMGKREAQIHFWRIMMRVTLFLLTLLMSVSLVAQELKGTGPSGSVDNRDSGGPDAFGYTFVDSDEPGGPTYAFEDISGTGTPYFLGDDAGTPPLALGFDFDFYGTTYTSVFGSSNGYLSFDGSDVTDFTNDCPLAGGGISPTNSAFPFWVDMDPGDDGAALYAESFPVCPYTGSGGSGACLIVQWEEFDYFPGDGVAGGSAGTFQAIVFESGNIVYQYGDLAPNGAATVAISQDAGANSLTYGCAPSNVRTGLAIEFAPGVVAGEDPIARFQVSKNFDDNNTAEVDVEISCNTGLPISQEGTVSQFNPITFVVTDFNNGELDCTITETDVDGYTASYNNGATTSATSCEFTDVVYEQFSSCTITNSLDEVTVEVTKEWVDDNPGFNPINIADATWFCNGAFGDEGGNLDFYAEGSLTDTESFTVYPLWNGTTSCSITEVNLPDGGVEVDDASCQSMTVLPGAGASCTITNTRLYEGIPTLSQYGLALMALLMLGVGFVAFRRIG